MHETVITNINPDMPLSPTCAEEDQVAQFEIPTLYAVPGFPLEFRGARNPFIEYITEGNLDKAGTVNPPPAGPT